MRFVPGGAVMDLDFELPRRNNAGAPWPRPRRGPARPPRIARRRLLEFEFGHPILVDLRVLSRHHVPRDARYPGWRDPAVIPVASDHGAGAPDPAGSTAYRVSRGRAIRDTRGRAAPSHLRAQLGSSAGRGAFPRATALPRHRVAARYAPPRRATTRSA
jgi:hypothetical protein